MNKRAVRDFVKLLMAIIFFWLYIPHLLITFFYSLKCLRKNRVGLQTGVNIYNDNSNFEKINNYNCPSQYHEIYDNLILSDVVEIKSQINLRLGIWLSLLFLLHNSSYFRSLFYYRIGPAKAFLISWYRPGNRYFSISYTTTIGRSFCFFHPFSTVVNAESIGNNFTCLQCTTIGATSKGKPSIGDNVSLGANVTIIGNVVIGNNVTIGAGSVVVKNIPDNVVAAGNPAKVIKVKS